MDKVLCEGMSLTTTYEGETMASFRIAGKAVGAMRRIYDAVSYTHLAKEEWNSTGLPFKRI